MGVKYLPQEHNTMFPARARNWTSRWSRVECTNNKGVSNKNILSGYNDFKHVGSSSIRACNRR